MFRYITLLICLVCIIKPLIAQEYHSERYKYHVTLIKEWAMEEDERKKKVSIIHPEKIGTINIIGFYYPDTITANGLQQKRMGSIYDGWVNIFEREGSEKENNNAAVEESYIALYTKHELDDKLKVKERMVAEYYYVRDKNAYVISLETYKDKWPFIQKEFKKVVHSFWVGQGDKPIPKIVNKEEPIGIENTQQGVSAENRRFIDANPEFQKLLVKQWEHNINVDFINFVDPVIYKDVLYTASSDKLMALKIESGKEIWSFKITDPLEMPLIIQNDILFFKKNKPTPSLYAIISETGNILYKVPLAENTSAMSYINKTLFLIENQAIVALDPSSGKVLWKKEYQANHRFYPIGKKGKVIFIKNNNVVVVCDPKNGDILWEKRIIGFPLYSPSVHDDKLIVSYEKQLPIKQSFISAYNLDSGKHIWSFKNRMDKINLIKPPSISTDYLFVPLEVQELNTQSNIKLLTAFDVKNGNVVWQLSSNLNFEKILTPVVTEKYLLLSDTRDESFHIIDLVTGEKVPHMFNDTETNELKNLYYFTTYKSTLLKWIKVNGEAVITCYM